MPNAGDSFVIELSEAHLGWGEHRHTETRRRIQGEGYIPIPRQAATELGIFNNNAEDATTEYCCTSADGVLEDVLLLASGCTRAGDVYAKQFQGSGDLQLLGFWYQTIHAQVGDQIRVTFTGPNSLRVEKL